MVKLTSWFSILRWALILTLVLIIILSTAPLLFPRHFERHHFNAELHLYNTFIIVGLCVFGLLSICCYFYYLTIVFGIILTVYFIAEIVLGIGNIGHYLTLVGVITCSFTYCAVMRRLKNEALYGP